MNNSILRNAVVTIASFVFVISVVSAWTAPTGVPPTNNVSAPINVGGDQIKSGALGVAALVSLGGVQVGTTTAPCTFGPTGTAGTVRWYKGAMEYCNGTAWVAFGGGGGESPVNDAQYATIGGLVWDKVDQGNKTYNDAMSYCAGRGMFLPSITDWDNAKGLSGGGVSLISKLLLISGGNDRYRTSSVSVDYGPLFYAPQYGPQNGSWTTTNTDIFNMGKDSWNSPFPVRCARYLGGGGGGGGGVETDPTVPANLKDGVSWGEISGTPIDTAPPGTICGMKSEMMSEVDVPCKGVDFYRWGCPSGYSVKFTNTGSYSLQYCVKQ